MKKLKSILPILLLNLCLFVGLIYLFSKGIFSFLDTYTHHNNSVCMPDLSALTLEEAKEKLEKLELRYDIDDSFYDPTYKPNQILNFAPLSGEFIKKNREVYIQINGSGLVSLPEVVGKEKSTAMSLIFEADLSIKNFIYLPADENKDRIIEVLFEGKVIKGGSKLPHQSKIDLVVGRGKDEEILVPDLRGMELDLANKILEKYDFKLGKIYYREKDSKSNLRIYRQFPFHGKTYNQNKPIDLLVSEAKDEELENLMIASEKEDRKKEELKNELKTFFKKKEDIIIE